MLGCRARGDPEPAEQGAEVFADAGPPRCPIAPVPCLISPVPAASPIAAKGLQFGEDRLRPRSPSMRFAPANPSTHPKPSAPPSGAKKSYRRYLETGTTQHADACSHAAPDQGACGPFVRQQMPRSEIRFVRHRDVVVEQILIVLCARLFMHWHLDTPQFADCRPRLIKRVGILDAEGHLECLAVID